MHTIIDCNAVCHAAKYSIGSLSWEEKQTGIIFGFLRQLLKLSKLYKHDFIFCWDSKESFRKKIYPKYKFNRDKNKTEEEKQLDAIYFRQFDTIKTEVLPAIGYRNIFEVEGFESDDLIARLVSDGIDAVIATSDSDLYQLLIQDEIMMHDLRLKQLIQEHDFTEKYGISPALWSKVKALAGCDSDNVEGISGVGIKTAVKYLNGELNPSSATYKKIKSDEGEDIFNRNFELVDLPHSTTPSLHLKKEVLSFRAFIKVCTECRFASMLHNNVLENYKKHLRLI